MKNFIKSVIGYSMMMLCIGVTGCKEMNGYNDIVSSNTDKPAVVTNIRVDNFNGGAHIIYDLPNSENVLYVLAKYKINSKTERETKSSYYTDTVTVNGFSSENEYEVTLYTVSRANIFSDPVTVKVVPKKPIFQMVAPTMQLSADFGGINVKAKNPLKSEIGLIFLAKDKVSGALEVKDQHFTKAAEIDYSVRGFESAEQSYAVYVTDKWGNISDTLINKLTPLYEEQLDKNRFSAYNLNSDTPIDFGWSLPYLWDGRLDGNGWHTRFGEIPPYVCTFNVGKTYKLSRFVMYQRTGEFTYGHGNPKDFAIWGSNVNQPRDAALPAFAAEGTVIGDWINLGNYHFPDPPSGLGAGQTNSADEAYVKGGISFNVPFAAPEVKYVRLSVANTWSNGTAAHVMEMTFFGSPK